MKLHKLFPGVHELLINTYEQRAVDVLNVSDVHYDSKHCDRDLLHKHLKEAEAKSAFVFINGDFFDLMQGRYDPRSGKYDIRPEYKHANYLDQVINDGADYLSSFNLTYLIGQGNHETNITKRLETNPIERMVERMRYAGKEVDMGGYEGWCVFRLAYLQGEEEKHNGSRTVKMYYHHGSGGGAPRTKGMLSSDMYQKDRPDADIITSGHDHNKWYMPITIDRLRANFEPYYTTVHHIRSGSYKLKQRGLGWEVERGFATPRMGGWWMNLALKAKNDRHIIEIAVSEAQ
jgi:hypothetical protein